MPHRSRYHFRFKAMGGPCSIQFYADSENEASLHAKCAMDEVYRLEKKYSRYRDDSVISQINRVSLEGGVLKVDEETAGLLNYAHAAWQESEGLFDVTSGILRQAWDFKSGQLPLQQELDSLLPRVGWHKLSWKEGMLSFPVAGIELDFGGIVKEYACDRVKGICIERGIQYGLIELGGDISIIGPQPDGTPWHVGIRAPRSPGQPIAMVPLLSGSLASSGDYERFMYIDGVRYSHLLNPKTGWPVESLASVTVIADPCVVAGSATTIAMLKGHEGLAWLEALGLPYLAIDRDGQHYGDALSS